MAERAQLQLGIHFPGYPAELLWGRKTNDGYTTLPRTLPLVMQAIDAQTKGRPAGHTLFCLWARSPDNPLVVIENPFTFASEAGFEGKRAVDTWKRRMRDLFALHFIEAKPGPSGEFHYVLLLNPNVAVERLKKDGKLQVGLYSRFVDRVMEVGASKDIEDIRALWAAEESQREAAKAAKTADKPEATKAPRGKGKPLNANIAPSMEANA